MANIRTLQRVKEYIEKMDEEYVTPSRISWDLNIKYASVKESVKYLNEEGFIKLLQSDKITFIKLNEERMKDNESEDNNQ